MVLSPDDPTDASPHSLVRPALLDSERRDEEGSVVIFADRVVLGGGSSPLRIGPATIRVVGTKISEVTELSREAFLALPRSPLIRTEDAGDRLISPAFINAHTHLPMVAFRGIGGLPSLRGNVIEDLYYRLESHLEPDDIRAFARLGAYESLLSGVGVVHDHYYGGQALADALLDVGLAGVVSPTLQDLAGPGVPWLEKQLEATLAIHSEAKYLAGGVAAALGPHATDTVSASLWTRLVTMGEELGLPVHFHGAQSFEEVERCHQRHGCSPFEWLDRLGVLGSSCRLLLVHGILASRADLARLSPERHALALCPYSQFEYCFPADVREWIAAGIPWMVGTDCANSNDSMSVQKELRLISGMHLAEVTHSEPYRRFLARGTAAQLHEVRGERQRAFESVSALRQVDSLLASVWSTPGAFHPRVPAGCIAPGQLAHLVVWDTEHPAFWPGTDLLRGLTYSETAPAIDWMMVAGQFRGERGRFHASILEDGAYRESREEARSRLTRHLARF